ncbi:hypothetical protein TNCV_172131 [Trichonephila clavipes]|nr:hypothetical protein TNCV_172131 [Trichonephila clavipes]
MSCIMRWRSVLLKPHAAPNRCGGIGCKAAPCSTRWIVVGDLPVEAASARTLVPGVWSTACNTPSSNMGVRAIHRRPVPSIVALKDPRSTRF